MHNNLTEHDVWRHHSHSFRLVEDPLVPLENDLRYRLTWPVLIALGGLVAMWAFVGWVAWTAWS